MTTRIGKLLEENTEKLIYSGEYLKRVGKSYNPDEIIKLNIPGTNQNYKVTKTDDQGVWGVPINVEDK
jgi:hypothetical protein